MNFSNFQSIVVSAWITRSNPNQNAIHWYPYRHECLEPNPRYHPGKALLIYRRFQRIIDAAIAS